MVDAINLRTGSLETVDFRTLAAETRHPDLFRPRPSWPTGRLRAPMFRTQELAAATRCA